MKVCAKDQKALASRAKGRDYRSDAEVKHGLWLLAELRAGRVKEFEFEKSYDLEVEGKLVCRIWPDFTVWMPDGRREIHEIKYPATESKVWAIKRKLFEILYPEYRYREYICGTEKKPWFINLEDE